MSSDSVAYREPLRAPRFARALPAVGQRLRARPELVGLVGIAAILNLWGLSINGWANTYYSAAVRSMSTSWHDFLFASMDKSGLMTIDKPPLAVWVQALSARIFGFHPLSLLIPQALMGVAATVLMYDLTRRRFGRAAGFAAGFALATTPVVVAVSRHNNPDELLVLCCVAALWCALRALENGRTRWLVLSGILVGLGFETKMGVALMVVPGIAAAYLWVAPRGRLVAVRQLLAGGAAMAVVGLAWPVLVTLTPAADRPWISGTADNSVWSLMFSYNGLGRIAGQSGGPGALGGGGGGGNVMFGGNTGVFRLLQTGLGDQAGWLLGFAVVAGLAVLVFTRLRRTDPRTGWLMVVGGAFLTTAVVFSFASGIFHPYYVSFLAPFTAALIGAGVGEALRGGRSARIVAPLAIGAGAVTELVVLGTIGAELSWAKPLVIAVAVVCAVALAFALAPRIRWIVLTVAMVALFAAPATWAAETIGHATSSTFPTGGPASATTGGLGGPPGTSASGHGRFPGAGSGPGAGALPPGGFAPPGSGSGSASGPGAVQSLFGNGNSNASAGGSGVALSRSGTAQSGSGVAQIRSGGAQSGSGGAQSGSGVAQSGSGVAQSGFRGPGGAGSFGGRGPGGFGTDSATLNAAIKYAEAHGGGAIGVASQSSAAAAIISSDANVAGLGGFSGRESSVTASWVAMEVKEGHLRWVIVDNQGFRAPGDTRQGSQTAMDIVAKGGKAVKIKTSTGTLTMYDLKGRATAIQAAAGGS